MTNKDIMTKVQKWCHYEVNNVLKHYSNAEKATDRCFGILMFVTNSILNYDSPESKELVKWWEDEMLPEFRELERK